MPFLGLGPSSIVGSCVGPDVGVTVVGKGVGFFEGLEVGKGVGFFEGLEVGEGVGFFEGLEVGEGVGFFEGLEVGKGVGFFEGLEVDIMQSASLIPSRWPCPSW